MRISGRTLPLIAMLGATAVVLLVAALPASASSSAPGPIATTAGERAKVRLLSSPYGPMLFTGRGRALYLFRPDGRNRSTCYGQCAADWPPLRTRRRPIAGRYVRKRLLGTTRRQDGTRQVTYRGHPLYTYAHEGRRQVLCHDVFLNGGLWLAVRRSGRPVPH